MGSAQIDNKKPLLKKNEVIVGIEKNTQISNGKLPEEPPDGGFRACITVVASFLTIGLLFGVINSYSIIYVVLQKKLESENIPNSESKAALVGALAMGTTFLLSPLSGVLTGLFGLRYTAVLGGSIAVTGLLASSFLVDNVDMLCFTYGIVYGLGASLAYTPSLAILGHYFKRRLGLVNGIASTGSSVFTVIIPPLMDYVIVNYGLHILFRLLAVTTIGVIFCTSLFKPIYVVTVDKPLKKVGFQSYIKNMIDIEIWKNKKYCFWALSVPISLFGYFVPYVHIKKYVEINFENVPNDLPLQCIALTSVVGRMLFGILADKKWVNRIILQQFCFYIFGILRIVLPFVKSYPLLIAVSLGMGVFDGAFIALIGPIANHLCGSAYAAQGIGYLFGLAAFPLSVGPSIAGLLYSASKTYTLPFVLAGVSSVVGATAMFSAWTVK